MNFVRCGIMMEAGDVTDIVCDVDTGDCILMSDLQGNCIIEQIHMTDPVSPPNQVLKNLLEGLNADGVIRSVNYIYKIKDDMVTAIKVPEMEEEMTFPFVAAAEVDDEIVY